MEGTSDGDIDIKSKLGECEVCNKETAKYTCPKCEVKTCSLQCVKIHKAELKCTGERDKLVYKPLSKFTNLDLLSDYRFMEDVTRSLDSYQRDPSKRYSRIKRDLPHHLFQLKKAAIKRGCRLNFLPQNFSRHKRNSTFFDWKKNVIHWRIEWVFPQADNLTLQTERALETEKLSCLFSKQLNPGSEVNPALQFYCSAGAVGTTLLLKAEGIKRSNSRFYELDPFLSIKANLKGKFIVEHPIVFVIMKDHKYIYDIVDSDEELEDVADVYFPGNIPGTRIEKETDSSTRNYLFNNDFSHSDSDDENVQVPKMKKLDIPAYDVLIKKNIT